MVARGRQRMELDYPWGTASDWESLSGQSDAIFPSRMHFSNDLTNLFLQSVSLQHPQL